MNINKKAWYALNLMLLLSLVIGHYELVEIKTLVAVFITPAFIVSASLSYKAKKEKLNN
ncbi:hypothetical protein [Psychroflexus tropicus]|uniref:hypothetical protein n=1 Tax=Psychroflexus tropicus TaxID=197345 RepID=UPI0003792270|nr:hypothetical protein [Psychroflexus tropicus]